MLLFVCIYIYIYWRENGRNVSSFRAWPLCPATRVGYELGGSAPHQRSWGRMLSGRRAVVIVCGLLKGLVVNSLTSRFFVNSHLDHSRAWMLTAAPCTADFPPIFLQLRKGPLWSCAELLQSYVLCSSDQCRTVKLPRRLPVVRELFWGMLGREDGGWRGIGVSGSGYNEVLALEVRNVVWLRWTKETCKVSSLYNGSSCVHCHAVVPGVLACVHMHILYVWTCIYVYICMCVCICTSMRLYTCVCICVCVFVHRLWVLVSVFQRVDGVMHAHVFFVCMCMRMRMVVGIYICAFFAVRVTCTLQVF